MHDLNLLNFGGHTTCMNCCIVSKKVLFLYHRPFHSQESLNIYNTPSKHKYVEVDLQAKLPIHLNSESKQCVHGAAPMTKSNPRAKATVFFWIYICICTYNRYYACCKCNTFVAMIHGFESIIENQGNHLFKSILLI